MKLKRFYVLSAIFRLEIDAEWEMPETASESDSVTRINNLK